MSNNIAEAITAKNEVIAQQGTSLDTVLTALEGKAAGSGDISLGLTSATVGQTIKVKTVDTDGRPTSWEAADMAGEGETWKTVASIEITEPVEGVVQQLDAFSELMITISDLSYYNADSTKTQLSLNVGDSFYDGVFGVSCIQLTADNHPANGYIHFKKIGDYYQIIFNVRSTGEWVSKVTYYPITTYKIQMAMHAVRAQYKIAAGSKFVFATRG